MIFLTTVPVPFRQLRKLFPPKPPPGSLPAQSDVFAGEYGPKRLADLKLRVIEHNVLVVTKYYTRITTARLAELLDLKPEEVRVSQVCVCGGVILVVFQP